MNNISGVLLETGSRALPRILVQVCGPQGSKSRPLRSGEDPIGGACAYWHRALAPSYSNIAAHSILFNNLLPVVLLLLCIASLVVGHLLSQEGVDVAL